MQVIEAPAHGGRAFAILNQHGQHGRQWIKNE
jgi:hypothetical protein